MQVGHNTIPTTVLVAFHSGCQVLTRRLKPHVYYQPVYGMGSIVIFCLPHDSFHTIGPFTVTNYLKIGLRSKNQSCFRPFTLGENSSGSKDKVILPKHSKQLEIHVHNNLCIVVNNNGMGDKNLEFWISLLFTHTAHFSQIIIIILVKKSRLTENLDRRCIASQIFAVIQTRS